MAVAPASRSSSTTSHTWPSPEQFREQKPIVRLVSTIWALPQVTKVGATPGTHSFDLWVFLSEDAPEIEDLISAAERAYRAEARMQGFTLHVIPEGAVPLDALPPYETIVER